VAVPELVPALPRRSSSEAAAAAAASSSSSGSDEGGMVANGKDEGRDTVVQLFGETGCEGAPVREFRRSDSSPAELVGLCDVNYKSMRVLGQAEIDFFSSCHHKNTYVASQFPSEGCVTKYNYPVAKSFVFAREHSVKSRVQIPDSLLDQQFAMQDHRPSKPAGAPAKARIVFSCESSEYFGYQVWANFYGFLTSGQESATWTRLMTGRERDDLPGVLPGLATFQAKRTLYSKRYSPINKPDVIAKWYESPDRPREEVIVVIDPDNWLLKDVSRYVNEVTKGHAIGEPAYFHGSRSAQRMWKEICLNNCDWDMDLVGVPYVVHRDDLKVIAPLWRYYTMLIKDRNDKDEDFKSKYGRLDLSWAAEMFGYTAAAAHAGVKHKVVRRIQVRDVDGEHRASKLQEIAMIHVGRAWVPKGDPLAKKYGHTEGKSFSHFGDQVWCKCNHTASTIMPWPIPPGTDFQSTKTLEILHYSRERFGPIPENSRYRAGTSRRDYGHALQ
ncbi:Peptidyl serine alpha-galactosyltransferase (AtSGT1), partial [Durusdinium trenchii]